MAKVYLDRSMCIGCGLCANLDEGNFEMIDGKARPINGKQSDKPDVWISETDGVSEILTQAVELCATAAIKIEEINS